MQQNPSQAVQDTFREVESKLKQLHLPPAVQKAAALAPLVLAVGGAVWWWTNSREKARRRDVRKSLWLRQIFEGVDFELAGSELFGFVRDALLGQRRKDLQKLLGHPQAAGDEAAVFADPPRDREQGADMWYYRLDRVPGSRQPLGAALVVQFDEDDTVDDARFILPPIATAEAYGWVVGGSPLEKSWSCRAVV